MNILILSWRGPGHPNAGGAEISTHEHAKGWVKAGHHVTLFTSYYQGAERKEIIDGVDIIREGNHFPGVQLKAFFWYFFGNHPKFDLVVDQFHGIPFFTPVYVKGKKLAFIHEVTKEVWKFNNWPWPSNLIPATIGLLFEPFIFRLLYRKIPFMTVSESTKKDLITWRIPLKNITIVHNGINMPKLKNFPEERRKTLIFLGVLSRDKGIEDALQVFSILDSSRTDWQFWVVGKADPVYFKKLKFLSEKLLLGNRIKFWGYVSEKRKFELLARSHILLNPSIREGWGLVVLEAASVGTPTVAFNVPGLRDSIIDNKTGILTQKNTPEEMARNVLNLMRDQPRYIRMCHYAKKWSSKFSWANSIKQSLSLLRQVYENT